PESAPGRSWATPAACATPLCDPAHANPGEITGQRSRLRSALTASGDRLEANEPGILRRDGRMLGHRGERSHLALVEELRAAETGETDLPRTRTASLLGRAVVLTTAVLLIVALALDLVTGRWVTAPWLHVVLAIVAVGLWLPAAWRVRYLQWGP